VGEMPAASQRAEKDERHTGNKSSDAAVVFSSFHQSAKLQQQPNKKKNKEKRKFISSVSDSEMSTGLSSI
jgi:hypothetical protein